jgi:hypothetical protein
MPKEILARERDIVIRTARHALTRTIEQYLPAGTDTTPIAAAAISSMFADLVARLSMAPDLVGIINRQIERRGYRLVEIRRN